MRLLSIVANDFHENFGLFKIVEKRKKGVSQNSHAAAQCDAAQPLGGS